MRKNEGEMEVLKDAMILGHNSEAEMMESRVGHIVDYAVEKMTLPEESKKTGPHST